jgi:hypothetical protein
MSKRTDGIANSFIIVKSIDKGSIFRALKSLPIPEGYLVITEVDGYSVYDMYGAVLSQYLNLKRIKY